MLEYQLRCVGSDGIEATCVTEADSDEECCEIAAGVLASGGHRSIEVWKCGVLISHLSKPNPDQNPDTLTDP